MTATIQQVCAARIAMNEKKLGAWPPDWDLATILVNAAEEGIDKINYLSILHDYTFAKLAIKDTERAIGWIQCIDPTVLDRALYQAQCQKEENDAWVDMQTEKFERMKETILDAHSAEMREDLKRKIADLDKELADKQLAIEYMTSRLAAKADLVERIKARILAPVTNADGLEVKPEYIQVRSMIKIIDEEAAR